LVQAEQALFFQELQFLAQIRPYLTLPRLRLLVVEDVAFMESLVEQPEQMAVLADGAEQMVRLVLQLH
jgi:hypothetical protein